MYQIKTVSTLTGINTDTVRAWERRYQAVTPLRDDKGRRRYSQQDIERLKLLAKMLKQGYSIGTIAHLDDDVLIAMLNENVASGATDHSDLIRQMMQALEIYHIDRCEELLRRALISLPPLEYAQNILAPAMFRVGELWHEEKISIAQEHIFSSCVKRLIFSLINNMIPLAVKRPCITFTTLSGESHEFGILLTSFLAANLRYTCHYLGADLPGSEITKINDHLKSDIIVLSIINSPPSELIIEQIKSITASNPQTQLWVGGLGAKYLWENGLLPEVCIFTDDLKDFYQRADLFKTQYKD